MLPDTGLLLLLFRRRVVVANQLVMTILWLGSCSQAVSALRGGHGVDRVSTNYSNAQLSVRATLEQSNVEHSDTELSAGVVAGIVVGAVAGGVVLVIILALLIRCLCQRRKISSNQENPGSTSETKTPKSTSVWNYINCFRKRDLSLAARGSKRSVPPPIFGSDKLEPDDISDTSFVLPELGGPNPHNKFDGMEWVDIKGMDDDVLVEISTDLRKYQPRQ